MSKSTKKDRFSKLKKFLKKDENVQPSKIKGYSIRGGILNEAFVIPQDVISLVPSQVRAEGPKVVCTCGWSLGPSTMLYALGVAARDHQDETGHRLRSH